jgi:hypothetical protein
VGQIRTVARHAERVGLDPNTYLWSPFAEQVSDQYKVQKVRRRAPVKLIRDMRQYADWAEDQARVKGGVKLDHWGGGKLDQVSV